jgi:hypothetical protein
MSRANSYRNRRAKAARVDELLSQLSRQSDGKTPGNATTAKGNDVDADPYLRGQAHEKADDA